MPHLQDAGPDHWLPSFQSRTLDCRMLSLTFLVAQSANADWKGKGNGRSDFSPQYNLETPSHAQTCYCGDSKPPQVDNHHHYSTQSQIKSGSCLHPRKQYELVQDTSDSNIICGHIEKFHSFNMSPLLFMCYCFFKMLSQYF